MRFIFSAIELLDRSCEQTNRNKTATSGTTDESLQETQNGTSGGYFGLNKKIQ